MVESWSRPSATDRARSSRLSRSMNPGACDVGVPTADAASVIGEVDGLIDAAAVDTEEAVEMGVDPEEEDAFELEAKTVDGGG